MKLKHNIGESVENRNKKKIFYIVNSVQWDPKTPVYVWFNLKKDIFSSELSLNFPSTSPQLSYSFFFP